MALFLARCICCTTRIYKVLCRAFVCTLTLDMSVPPDAYPPGRPSAYLNTYYKLRRVDTIDGEDRFEKIHLACDRVFSHKHPNPTLDALHVMNCPRSSLEHKKIIASKCKSRSVQDKWNDLCVEMQQEQAAFLRSDDPEAALPVPSQLATQVLTTDPCLRLILVLGLDRHLRSPRRRSSLQPRNRGHSAGQTPALSRKPPYCCCCLSGCW